VSDLFVVMSNAVPGQEDEFNSWYSNRHLADLLAIPGVRAAQRFQLALPGPSGAVPDFRYLALYEADTGAAVDVNHALQEAAAERPVAIAAGREPRIPRSPAMATPSLSFWARPLTERRTHG
jgi:hypothetical protein